MITTSKRIHLLGILPLLMITVYFIQFTVLPFQEFPDWQFQGWIWNQFVFHQNYFGGYYMMNPYIPPNATFTILIGLLNCVLSPTTAGKIAVLVSCFMLYSGIFLFVRMHLRRAEISQVISTVAASSLALLFVFNFNLFFGQIHFLLGLGIALCGAYFFQEKRWGTKPFAMMTLLTLCYCTHFMAFAQLVLYIFLTIIIEKRREYIRPMIIALIPVGMIFTHYFLTSHLTGVEATLQFEQILKEKVMVFPRIIAPFVRLKYIVGSAESGIKIVNFTITAAWMGAILWTLFLHWKNKRLSVLDWVMTLTFAVAVILPPISLGMFAPGERFVLFGAIAGILLFLIEFPQLRVRTVAALIILAMANYGWSLYQTSQFERMVENGVKISKSDKSGLVDPCLRLIYYKTLREHTTIPIFTTGLFNFSDGIKPDIYFYTGQMKVNEGDTSSTNKNLYDQYR
jgi:hypothetical protein